LPSKLEYNSRYNLIYDKQLEKNTSNSLLNLTKDQKAQLLYKNLHGRSINRFDPEQVKKPKNSGTFLMRPSIIYSVNSVDNSESDDCMKLPNDNNLIQIASRSFKSDNLIKIKFIR